LLKEKNSDRETALATIIVETLLIRPVSASVNTLLPGWTYGAVLILKVCLLSGVIASCVFIFKQLRLRWFPSLARAGVTDVSVGTARSDIRESLIPSFAILSLLLSASAPLISAISTMMAQAIFRMLGEVTMREIELLSRGGVVVMGVCLIAALIMGGLSLRRREREQTLALLSIAMNALLIVLFWYWQFYAAGFDQDRWAT
jgi:hypothetical protein